MSPSTLHQAVGPPFWGTHPRLQPCTRSDTLSIQVGPESHGGLSHVSLQPHRTDSPSSSESLRCHQGPLRTCGRTSASPRRLCASRTIRQVSSTPLSSLTVRCLSRSKHRLGCQSRLRLPLPLVPYQRQTQLRCTRRIAAGPARTATSLQATAIGCQLGQNHHH